MGSGFDRRRLLLGLAILLVAGLAARPGGAQDGDAEATATRAAEEVELADLRTRVAELATEVARLEGDEAALAGRLGGSRATFDQAYGAPTAYIGTDQVAYDVPDVGRVVVTLADDRAVRVVLSAPRPPEKPASEPDAADWTIDEALRIADRFAPADASIPETLDAVEGDEPIVIEETSALLGDALGGDAGSDCPPADAGATFTVDLETPTPDTVSTITLDVAAPGVSEIPTPLPALESRPSGGASVAISSVGGTVTVNGIVVRALQTRFDDEDDGPASVAVELAIENSSRSTLGFEPPHFLLQDERGRSLPAVCGGEEPALTSGDLAPGESITGWVNFLVPERFEPDRFVYLVGGSPGVRVGFRID